MFLQMGHHQVIFACTKSLLVDFAMKFHLHNQHMRVSIVMGVPPNSWLFLRGSPIEIDDDQGYPYDETETSKSIVNMDLPNQNMMIQGYPYFRKPQRILFHLLSPTRTRRVKAIAYAMAQHSGGQLNCAVTFSLLNCVSLGKPPKSCGLYGKI